MDSLTALIAGPTGAFAALILFIVGLRKRWWVMGYHYDEMVADRNFYRDITLKALKVGETIADRTKELVGK